MDGCLPTIVRVSLSNTMLAPDWGDVPTWAGAIFTGLGFLAAGVAGFVAYKIYGVESQRDAVAAELQRLRDEEAIRAQASVVAAWYSGERRDHLDVLGNPTRGWYTAWGVWIANGSPVPIYDIRVDFYYSDPAVNDGKPNGPRGHVSERVVPPGQQFIPAPKGMLRDAEAKDMYLVALTFRDSLNRRWHRSVTGELRPAA